MNVLDRLYEKQRERADDLTRLERLVLAKAGGPTETLLLAADLYNLQALADGREPIPCMGDMSALTRYEVERWTP